MVLTLVLGLILGGGPTTDFGPDLARWSSGAISRLSKDEQSKFMVFVKSVLVSEVEPKDVFCSPRLIFENHGDAYVWQLGSGQGYGVLLNPSPIMVPSAAHAWLFYVDKKGTVRMRSDFDIGDRSYAKHASYEMVSWLANPVVVQEIYGGWARNATRKIFIGFDGMRPTVVRLEDEHGHLRPMDYYAPNWVVGPKFNPPTVEGLVTVLKGDNDVKRLEALVWLADFHSRVSHNKKGWDHEATVEERLYLKAIKSPDIADAIKQLRESSNTYVSKLAFRVPIGVGNFDPWPWF